MNKRLINAELGRTVNAMRMVDHWTVAATR